MVTKGVYDRTIKDKPDILKQVILHSFKGNMPEFLLFAASMQQAGFMEEQSTFETMRDWIAETCTDTQSTENKGKENGNQLPVRECIQKLV